ncbi:MAG TPA: ABA4-like family protein, partial [Pyrinomonadaceae bacterium]|nr:ABA4-like family protein [Pyrinomonadaceae bacterium]
MYVALFNVAGWAILAWVLLIFLPKWRVTRLLARAEIFPVFLAVLYVIGVVRLLVASGPGVMRDFGSAEGVTRLLAGRDAALIAWIHILCFDQLVALYIYRDNMERRYVPVVVQSVLLVLTLMFGPAGYLLYYLLRLARRGRAAESSEFRVPGSELKKGRELETRNSKLVTALVS